MTKWMLAASATLVSAVALWFGTGLHPLWWVVWVAPLPVFLVARFVGPRMAFGIGAVAWLVSEMNVWKYLHRLEIPAPVVAALFTIPAAVFGLSVVLFRAFLKRGQLLRAAFVVPLLWVSYEFLWASASPHSTVFNLGYTQMNCLPLLQVVSVTGIWGLSFCLFLFSVTVAVLASRAGTKAEMVRLGAVVGAALVAVVGFGSWRLSSTPATGPSIRVALVASDSYPEHPDAVEKLLRDYSANVDAVAANGAQLIVLPEKIAVVSDEGTSHWDDVFRSSAARGRATVVAGIDRGSATRRWNEARVYSPAGTVEGIYEKHHLIPGFEDVDQVGTKLLVLKQPSGTWGVEICKDMDFPELSRQYGAAGIGLLIVPAWDFVVDGWLHGRMAVMRGVESGFIIVRSAKQGLLTVSDDRGRILAEQSSSVLPMGQVLTTAPVRHTNTLYVRYGNWFAWMNVAGLLAILALPKRNNAQSNHERGAHREQKAT